MANNPIAAGIISTANRLQMDPLDLATIISYETGGTFDPSQAGPTTQWGQHRGLIQFGEPQARQYGVNWDDPLNSQLGEGGAVEKYFLDRGWKPGMTQLDAYSIVNAGAPGKYNAMDSGSTVQDKVAGFTPHREKATTFLGSDYTGPVASAGQSQQQVPTANQLELLEPEPYRLKNSSDDVALYNFSSGPRPAIAQPGAQDIGILANLITPAREARARAVLDNLKAFS